MTAPIALTYPDWGAQLEGPIRLADLALDLKGRLTIEEALDAALARAFGARDDYVPQTRVVDLASVRGELGAPKVQITGSAVATLAAAYAGQIEREELKKRIEKELGPGSGEIVDQGLEVLEDLLGGKKSRAGRSRRRIPPCGDFPSSFGPERAIQGTRPNEESPGCRPASSTSTTTGTCVRSSRKQLRARDIPSAPATMEPRRSRSSRSSCPI